VFDKLFQGVAQTTQSGKPLALIEKGRLVDSNTNTSQHLSCQ
jgi:hypothetical protein